MASELPVDIVLEIYHCYLVSESWNPNNCGTRPILTFAAVCQRWREILTGIPSLWTKVVFTSQDKFNFNTYLEKSFPCPYHVFLYTYPQRDSKPRVDYRRRRQTRTMQVEAIANHIDRLQTLNIRPTSYHDLESCLLDLADLTANSLREIRVEIQPVTGLPESVPNLTPLFPRAPNLNHISSPGRCMYMYPTDLTSLTTLNLVDVCFSLSNFRDLFNSLPSLTVLSFTGFGEPLDPLYMRVIHTSDVREPIDVPSLRFLSVGHSSWPSQRQCSCFLPIFYFPNLEVLEISYRTFSSHRDDTDRHRHPKLHFHPRSVQTWNDPSSPFHKIRFKGIGWRWAPDIFTDAFSSYSTSNFNKSIKLLELEWMEDVLAGMPVPMESSTLSSYMKARLNTVHFTKVDEISSDLEEKHAEIVVRWLQSVRSLLSGPITAVLPQRLSGLREFSTFASTSLFELSVVFSDKLQSIWDDVREGGCDVPKYSIKAKNERSVQYW